MTFVLFTLPFICHFSGQLCALLEHTAWLPLTAVFSVQLGAIACTMGQSFVFHANTVGLPHILVPEHLQTA